MTFLHRAAAAVMLICSAHAIAGNISITPSSLDFGQQPISGSTPSTLHVLVKNESGDLGNTVFVDSPNITGTNAADFSATGRFQGGCDTNTSSYPYHGTNLSSGQSCSIRVTFAPGDLGQRTATPHVIVDGIEYLAPLSGTGAPPPPAPTVTISVNPSTVTTNQTATLTWSSTDASSCTAGGAWDGSQTTSGSQSVAWSQPGGYMYTLTCTGNGGSASNSATLTVNPAPPTVTVTLNPSSVTPGQPSTLSWSSTDTYYCDAGNAWYGRLTTSGSTTVSKNAAGSYSYELSCTGGGGTATNSATLTVSTPIPAPAINISFDRTSIAIGETSTLTWSTANANSCTASNVWSGDKALSGSTSVSGSAAGSYTYTLTCTGGGGSASNSATVTVRAPAPTVAISSNPSSVYSGQISQLTWSSENASTCTASDTWNGYQPTSGNVQVSQNAVGSYIYTLTCSGSGGSASNSTVLTVLNPPAQPPNAVGNAGGGGSLDLTFLAVLSMFWIAMRGRFPAATPRVD